MYYLLHAITGKVYTTFHIVSHYELDEFVIQMKNSNIGGKNIRTT